MAVEKGTVELSSTFNSAVQAAPIPIETSNPDRPPNGIVKS